MVEEVEDTSPRRRRRAVVVILVAATVLVLGGLTASLLYLNSLRSAFDDSVQTYSQDEAFPEEESRPERPDREGGQEDESLNILLLGSDSGGGSGEEEGLADVPDGGRADTMMLVHVPHDRDGIQVMSIMRDLWVEIPGEGHHQINASLSLGGVPKAVETVESLFDARIDHVASVDMIGFQQLVDTMGGVTVDSPVAFTSRDGHSFTEGEQQMDSAEALSFVRERGAFDDGDHQRVQNQQALVIGVIDEILQPSTLTHPGRVHEIVEDFSPHLTLDETLDSGTLGELGWEMREVRSGDVEMFTLPTAGYSRERGQQVILPDEAAVEEVGEALRNGELPAYAEGR